MHIAFALPSGDTDLTITTPACAITVAIDGFIRVEGCRTYSIGFAASGFAKDLRPAQ